MTTQILVYVEKSGNGSVYFVNGPSRTMAQPLAQHRYPTHVDMAIKALEVADRKLPAGTFCRDVVFSTPETRAARFQAVMSA